MPEREYIRHDDKADSRFAPKGDDGSMPHARLASPPGDANECDCPRSHAAFTICRDER